MRPCVFYVVTGPRNNGIKASGTSYQRFRIDCAHCLQRQLFFGRIKRGLVGDVRRGFLCRAERM